MKRSAETFRKIRQWLRLAPLVFAIGCATAALPCSEADLAETVAVCTARVRLECAPLPDGKKDRDCPAYVECKQKIDAWQACK